MALNGEASLASALDQLMEGPLGAGLSRTGKVARAWYASNGDRERLHTTGVWLQKGRRDGVDPVLVVAVDSPLFATELGTNKDLYLARLSYAGVAVSDIRFTVRPPSDATDRKRGDATRHTVKELPELSSSELERVRQATEALPDGLRQSVSRAMRASLKRSKVQNS